MKESIIQERVVKNVKGYEELTSDDKERFLKTYVVHQACHGTDYKDKWIATSVKKEEDYLRVEFVNGEWLHYFMDGSWG